MAICNVAGASSFNIFDTDVEGANCPIYSPFFGVMGATAAMVFSGEIDFFFPFTRPRRFFFFIWCLNHTALGAAYGTAKSGTGIAAMSIMRPELIMKSIIPVVMAGIIAIYGLVVSVLIAQGLTAGTYSLFKYARLFSCLTFRGFIDLGAGLSVGISGLAAGFAIGIVGDSGVRGTAQQPKVPL